MNVKAIYLSIKPQYTKLIESGEKDHEFRKYIPKQDINTLYVYESSPTSVLKYIINLNKIVEYPDKINLTGYGNKAFNAGLKSKFAYEIESVFMLEYPIPLIELKEKYDFVPPQGYAYDYTYPKLTQYIKNTEKKLIITRRK